ncbi:MAG TPA: LuxR family transcriptional regulator, partial [Nocardioides sp.]|nr:LuxR family transcriptional regulator [Nocardioides sp.]
RLSSAYWRLCRGPEAVAAARSAVSLLEPHGSSEELARAWTELAAQSVANGEHAAALELSERALRVAELLGLPDVTSDLLNTIGCVHQTLGQPWRDDLDRALAVALEAGADKQIGRAYANLQAMSWASLDFTRAESVYREGLEYCEAHDIPTYANCLIAGQVDVLEATGRFDEAVQLGRDRMAVADLSPINKLSTHITLGKIGARRGDPAAWGHLDTALADGLALDEEQYLVVIHLARAEAYWFEGDLEPTLGELRHAARANHGADPLSRGILNTWLARLGQDALPGPMEPPYAAQLSGEVVATVRLWDDLGAPYDAALTLLDSTDEDHWREAATRFDALGAEAAARIARRKLRDAGAKGISAGPRRTTRGHPKGLTRREAEVLRELAADLTNEEIAGRLVISPKTVDHHVSAVLTKLGVPNRRAAITEARRLGLLDEPRGQPGEPVVTT